MYADRVTISVVDDDDIVRRVVERMLLSAGYSVETFASAREYLASPNLHRPGCLVLDIKMPGIDGLELQQRLLDEGSIIPIIFITGHGDLRTGVEAMKKGAVDFLTKPFKRGDLLEALERAVNRGMKMRKDLEEQENLRQRFAALTNKEREVFNLVVNGLTNKEIGHELHASDKTVKLHRKQVMEKMDVDSLTELVRIAERLGM